MKRLDPRSQFILESYYLAGMPAAELAQRLGDTAGFYPYGYQKVPDATRQVVVK